MQYQEFMICSQLGQYLSGTLYQTLQHQLARYPHLEASYSGVLNSTRTLAISAIPCICDNIKRSKVSHIHFTTTPSPSFTPFCSTASYFQVQAILKQAQRMTPKRAPPLKGQRYPHVCCISTSHVPNLSPLRSMESRFRVTSNLGTSALNDPTILEL